MRKEERRKRKEEREKRKENFRPSSFIHCLLITIVFCLLPIASYSQCAMCRAALESEGSQKTAEGVNDGIVYLMAIPYILVGVVGYIVYKMIKKK